MKRMFNKQLLMIYFGWNFFQDYCATKWSILRERFDRGLYASHADLHRLKWVVDSQVQGIFKRPRIHYWPLACHALAPACLFVLVSHSSSSTLGSLQSGSQILVQNIFLLNFAIFFLLEFPCLFFACWSPAQTLESGQTLSSLPLPF